jgi:hypothetical protein
MENSCEIENKTWGSIKPEKCLSCKNDRKIVMEGTRIWLIQKKTY